MSEPIDDGGPAFPVENDFNKEYNYVCKGMTLRDWFAGQAMQAMLSNPANYGSIHEWRDDATVSEQAYEIADDMIKARKEKQ